MHDLKAPSPEALAQLEKIVGPRGALRAPADAAPYLHERRDLYHGRTPMVLRPSRVEEVSAILKLAHEERIGIVPQGGNTGLVGGQIPSEKGNEIVLSLDRMKAIRHIDAMGNSLIAEAGATLKSVQDAATEAGRLFPLSLGSEGSCQIGGNIATNAGGIHVVRYGAMRELVLGLEAVFPGGHIWHGLKSLRKDNTGYDLKNLLIGSEGTLGIVTAATLRLFPRPAEVATVLAGLPNLRAAADFFSLVSESAGPLLTAFELIPRLLLEFVLAHAPQSRDPLAGVHPWYVLFELSSPLAEGLAERVSVPLLEGAFNRGLIADAAAAASEAQAREFWRMREAMAEVQRYEGGSIKHDVSVPVSAVPSFIEEASAAVTALVPGARPIPFGHFGDGNIHFNVSQPKGMEKAAFLSRWEEVADAVHAIVLRFGGSISAEHGIGRLKVGELERYAPPVELELMRAIKHSLDPKGILNPGKVLRS